MDHLWRRVLWGDGCQRSRRGGSLVGKGTPPGKRSPRGVVGGGGGAAGSRAGARARGPARPRRGRGRRHPFPSGAGSAPGACDAGAFHGCYRVARGGAPACQESRAPAQAGGPGSCAQHQQQHRHRLRPRARALRPAAARVPAREPAPVPLARRRAWSCCAARAPGTRPAPGRTRGCWGTSACCRACCAWRSATCPAPPTSSACSARSSRTCGRCWPTGCWRYRRGPPPPALPSPRPRAAAPDRPGRPAGTSRSRQRFLQDASVAQTPPLPPPRPGLSTRHPSRLPSGRPIPSSLPNLHSGALFAYHHLFGRESGAGFAVPPPASPASRLLPPAPSS